MRIAPLVLVGLALLAPAAANARELPSELPDDVFSVDGFVHKLATNGSRTLVSGDIDEIGRRMPDGAIVSARGGAVRTGVELQDVGAVIADPAGGWYVAAEGGVRRVRADGAVDPAFAVTGEGIGALALAPDGATLWLAGRMHTVNGQPRRGVAAVDAASGQLRPWQNGESLEAGELALSPDGATVYVAGAILGPERSLVALDAATGAVRGYGPPEVGVGLAVSPDGTTVYLADNFGRLMALDAATLAERWRSSANIEPADVAVTPDGRWLFVTDPARMGGPAVLRFDAATGARTDWSTPVKSAGPIALSPDGAIAYLGRASVAGWPRKGGIAVATDDGALLGWAPGGEYEYAISSLAVSRDGAELFVESSPTLATRLRRSTAILDETGTPTPWVEPAPGGHAAVSDAVLDPQGMAYLSRGSSLSAVAPDGALRWRLAVTGGSYALNLSPDGRTLHLVGTFTAVGGSARPGLAALRASDGALLDWSLSAAGGHVAALRFSPDGRTLFVNGTFTSVNGVARAGLAALDAASGAVLAFDPRLSGPAGGRMRLSPDGGVLYVTVRSEDDPYAKLVGIRVADGAVVFAPAVKGAVRGFEPLADGETVIIGSDHRDFFGARPLTAWDARTSALLPWHQAECADCMIGALELAPDGRTLHVGGRVYWGGRSHFYLRLGVGRVPGTPVNVTPPQVVRPAASAPFAECDPGTWSGHPMGYRYAWTLDGVPVAGYDGHDLLVTAADAGRALRCEVRAGDAVATSPPWTVEPPATAFSPAPRRIGDALAPPTPTPMPSATPVPSASPAPTVPAKTRVAPPVTPGRSKPRDPAATVALTALRGAAPVRITLSERAQVTATLRSCAKRCRTVKRTFTLAAGRHTLTARRLTGRAKLPRGRHTLSLQARDAAGNVTHARALRFTM